MYTDKREKQKTDLLVGRNAVFEALRAERPVDSVLIAKGNARGAIHRIIELCKKQKVVVKEVSPAKLDALCGGMNHQGVAAYTAAHTYSSVEDILQLAKEREEPPFLILCDDINDPHNLGAIIRTAECCGAHGVVIPKRGAVGLTAAVDKAASGALEYLPVARVPNLTSVIKELQKAGVWVYGTDASGKTFYKTDLSGPIAIVIGSEGQGISRLVKETCDDTVSIPMHGKITSLNASVAAGIVLYEVAKTRLQVGGNQG